MRWTDFSKLILYTQKVENAPIEKLRMYLVAYNGVVRRMIYSGKQFVCRQQGSLDAVEPANAKHYSYWSDLENMVHDQIKQGHPALSW